MPFQPRYSRCPERASGRMSPASAHRRTGPSLGLAVGAQHRLAGVEKPAGRTEIESPAVEDGKGVAAAVVGQRERDGPRRDAPAKPEARPAPILPLRGGLELDLRALLAAHQEIDEAARQRGLGSLPKPDQLDARPIAPPLQRGRPLRPALGPRGRVERQEAREIDRVQVVENAPAGGRAPPYPLPPELEVKPSAHDAGQPEPGFREPEFGPTRSRGRRSRAHRRARRPPPKSRSGTSAPRSASRFDLGSQPPGAA